MPLWLRRLLGYPMLTAWFSHPIMLQHEPYLHHPDSPQRLSAIEHELKRQAIWSHLIQYQAEEANDAELALVHTRNYLRGLEAVQPPEGKIYRLDDDTVLTHDSLQAARYAAGAVIQAVNYVMQKKAHNAFCAVRPPGHHGKSAQSGSFCLINNVAVGAMHAIARFRVQKIAILDFDVHRGDGTEAIFCDDPRVLLLGISQDALYPFQSTPTLGKNPHLHNFLLPPFADSYLFRQVIQQEWLPHLKAFKPELVLLSAGFDAHRAEPLSDTELHEADYAWLTHKIMQTVPQCKGKIVSVLEGGYQPEALAKSVAAHLYVLTGMGKPECAVEYDKLLSHSHKKHKPS